MLSAISSIVSNSMYIDTHVYVYVSRAPTTAIWLFDRPDVTHTMPPLTNKIRTALVASRLAVARHTAYHVRHVCFYDRSESVAATTA